MRLRNVRGNAVDRCVQVKSRSRPSRYNTFFIIKSEKMYYYYNSQMLRFFYG